MSKPNKVNKDHYTQRGRLTADELARERARQIHLESAQRRYNQRTSSATRRRVEPASTPERNEREEQE
jgi:hypothetical protein